MNWQFFDLPLQEDLEAEFTEKLRAAYIASFFGQTYPLDGLPFESLKKRLKNSTDLAVLVTDAPDPFLGYAIFSAPEALLEGKKIIWQDSIGIDKSLQGKGFAKEVYDLMKSKIPDSGWLGGRTQNPAIIRSFCNKGVSFPFDELYSSKTGKNIFSFLKENIQEVRESEGIDTTTGIIKANYPLRLGNYENNWTGIEKQKRFLEQHGFDQNAGDAVIIVVDELASR